MNTPGKPERDEFDPKRLEAARERLRAGEGIPLVAPVLREEKERERLAHWLDCERFALTEEHDDEREARVKLQRIATLLRTQPVVLSDDVEQALERLRRAAGAWDPMPTKAEVNADAELIRAALRAPLGLEPRKLIAARGVVLAAARARAEAIASVGDKDAATLIRGACDIVHGDVGEFERSLVARDEVERTVGGMVREALQALNRLEAGLGDDFTMSAEANIATIRRNLARLATPSGPLPLVSEEQKK